MFVLQEKDTQTKLEVSPEGSACSSCFGVLKEQERGRKSIYYLIACRNWGADIRVFMFLSFKMLFKKNLFVMAINLAKSQHLDSDGLSEIFRQYGDHLYLKGDHDGAIQQYIR